ncbi:chorismate mutase [Leptospira inadai serovar Lyme str. 10]|uniref:Bifunctional chorismate mutase/prephenate dehydratase n=2 Tax=Leptospira inadai serovar Lyme TaxID=293084 RepID=V6HZY2_9LEPT|nr:prephenate dehydratase [Leptospira inadai]EQA38574.1 chorismate mutase [Leptospira inadai serovar Lyme str. 10]PNV76215.1 prephenate dehydratase [Leptospira inadai serovar Lyme]
MAKNNDKLKEFREKIDSLDKEIVKAILARAEIASAIGEIKRENNDPIYRPDREKDVYEKILNLNVGPLPDKVLIAIYREIMSGSFSVEKGLSVGYLGPEGSFSHQAVRARFGASVEASEFPSIPEVFRAVETDKVDYGVVPVENSSEGLVNSTLDQFLVSDLNIYSEIYLKITLNLLGFEHDLHKIETLYGIKIANSQCRNWIAANLPHVQISETPSTSRAASIVAEKKEGCAAIASSIAAEIYGLDVIRESIEDMSGNSTRFLIIGKNQCPPTGNDKTSIVLSVPDKPGSLYSVLKPFFDKGINLSKVETRPTRRTSWEYNFFIDFHGHRKDPVIEEVLSVLKENTIYLRVLGSYPVSPPNP